MNSSSKNKKIPKTYFEGWEKMTVSELEDKIRMLAYHYRNDENLADSISYGLMLLRKRSEQDFNKWHNETVAHEEAQGAWHRAMCGD
jgi:hypothetical protein